MCESKLSTFDLISRVPTSDHNSVNHAEKFKYINNILVADKNSDITHEIMKNKKLRCYTLSSRENLLK